ncbi:glycosyltransferase family 4 protein [Polaribacter sp. AHE13PA]|uniref:glycosyltransferase family 4 protein n=1 Tax=Polaribacter sp. AHE13PA TaxID=2745562 RepID=UPI001C4F27AF|nr:glycosyltransferase family 4 protein [Polaribacter sp. AHE13PA]QXP66969.1 glycosyltransferase family 4 protein [Polaribacter sp. AHE13PA]
MKVFFTPYYKNNPYQKRIIDKFSDLGMHIDIAATGAGAFFKTPKLKEANIIHFHWFEPFIKSNSYTKSLFKAFVFLVRLYFFKKDKKYVWTVHNLVNHEKKNVSIDRFFLFFFKRLIDSFFVHNTFTKEKLVKEFGISENKIFLIPHGNYCDDYSPFLGDKKAFKKDIIKIPEDKFTFTFLGNIRPYKGVLDLISAFKSMNNDNCQLLICGHVTNPEDKALIISKIAGYSNIYFKPGYVANNELQGYIKTSDVMVYPYKDILTSGSLILGMSLKSACLVSNVGSMAELINKEFVFNNTDDLVVKMDALASMDALKIKQVGIANFKKIEADTWLKMATSLKDVYSNLTKHN